MTIIKGTLKKYPIIFLLIFYTLFNVFFLINFPFVHSDEAWLSGLSRHVVTHKTMEYTYFDLYPTTHHTMKILFIGLQGLFIKVFGYSIVSLRSLSLICSLMALTLFYKVIDTHSQRSDLAVIFTGLFAFNLQMILVSHMARQEAPLLILFLLGFYILQRKPKHMNLILGSLLGIGIGVHPNSFFIALCFGTCYLYFISIRKRTFKDLFKLITITLGYLSLYLTSTFILNGSFISEYTQYGDHLGVSNAFTDKMTNLYYFYYKLFNGISGTYFTVDLKYDYLLMILLLFLLAYYLYKKNKPSEGFMFSLLFFISINIGLVIIGRYNQISIIFPITFLYFMMSFICLDFKWSKKYLNMVLIILLFMQIFHSTHFISNHNGEDYTEYLKNYDFIDPKASVLANLNLHYYFKDRLKDYRNLEYLDDYDLSIKEYIEMNNIEYIIWYEEMDYIKRNIDKWYILYGELDYYDGLKVFLEHETELVKTFESETYAMRIARYVDTYPFKVYIYKVKDPMTP